MLTCGRREFQMGNMGNAPICPKWATNEQSDVSRGREKSNSVRNGEKKSNSVFFLAKVVGYILTMHAWHCIC